MAATTCTITYISTPPSTTSQVVITLPTPNGSTPMDYSTYVKNLYLAGGLWFTNASGNAQFVPFGEIVSITSP